MPCAVSCKSPPRQPSPSWRLPCPLPGAAQQSCSPLWRAWCVPQSPPHVHPRVTWTAFKALHAHRSHTFACSLLRFYLRNLPSNFPLLLSAIKFMRGQNSCCREMIAISSRGAPRPYFHNCVCDTCLVISLQICLQAGELVAADNVAFARLILQHLPDKHASLVARLQSRPEMQYRQDWLPLFASLTQWRMCHYEGKDDFMFGEI